MKALASALIALSLAGCSAGPDAPPQTVVVGIDTSGSARPLLAAFVASTKLVAAKLHPRGKDLLTVYRFDSQAHELYSGPRPISLEHLQDILLREVAPSADRLGTLPTKFLQQAAAQLLENPQGPPATVFVLTDGGNDDLSGSANQAAKAVALEIAEHPRIEKVVFAREYASATAPWAPSSSSPNSTR